MGAPRACWTPYTPLSTGCACHHSACALLDTRSSDIVRFYAAGLAQVVHLGYTNSHTAYVSISKLGLPFIKRSQYVMFSFTIVLFVSVCLFVRKNAPSRKVSLTKLLPGALCVPPANQKQFSNQQLGWGALANWTSSGIAQPYFGHLPWTRATLCLTISPLNAMFERWTSMLPSGGPY